MTRSTSILWFRHDLRLDDNPACTPPSLIARRSSPFSFGNRRLKVSGHQAGRLVAGFIGHSRAWMQHSVPAASRLIIRQGNTLDNLLQLLEETGASTVILEPATQPERVTARDDEIESALRTKGARVETSNALLLFEPWTVQTKTSTPYKVFTPFYPACLALPEPSAPLNAPTTIGRPRKWPDPPSRSTNCTYCHDYPGMRASELPGHSEKPQAMNGLATSYPSPWQTISTDVTAPT